MTSALAVDRYEREHGEAFMTGVQALVRIVLDQRRRDAAGGLRTAALVSGYEGSPLAGLDLELARQDALLRRHDVTVRPAVNEELAATALMGSQLVRSFPRSRYDGVIGMWYGKAPGLDRASDAIKHANHIGVGPTGGVLAAVGDDPGCKSSTLPSQSEPALQGMLMPILYPGDVQDVVDLGVHGFALSRAAGVWVGFKMVTNVADGFGTVCLDPGRVEARIPVLDVGGRRFAHRVEARLIGAVPGELERTLHDQRLELARRYGRENRLNEIAIRGPRDRLGLVASGKTWFDLVQALRDLGLDEPALHDLGVRALRVRMPFPLDRETLHEFADGLDEVIVVEEKRAFLEPLIKDALYERDLRPAVVGKELVPASGELDPDTIARAIGPRLASWLGAASISERLAALDQPAPAAVPLPRTPYFCSGCPHNSSMVVPEGSTVGAGIGCHGMVLLMGSQPVGDIVGMTQMGGEGAQWIGMAPFTETEHFIQNLGDGTLAHSGSLAIRAAVAAGVNVTFKILFNSAVAMTGGQDAVGGLDVARLTYLLAAEGVRRTIVTAEDTDRYRDVRLAENAQVRARGALVASQQELAGVEGVTVLIHDQRCAAETRRLRKRGKLANPSMRVLINERVCEGCGDCGRKSNCLSVVPAETEFGRKTQIHQASCNADYSCLEGDCPSFVTVTGGTPAAPRALPALDPATLPEPVARVEGASFTARITGVGGTGIVTVAQVVAMAALLCGRHVRGLDQTGLAQKGGPVVSDLKITAEPTPLAARLAAQECDLYLGCDLLVAAEPRNLVAASTSRTIAVLSTSVAPTGAMVTDTALAYPAVDGLVARIGERSRADHELDARAIAERLFGSDVHAHFILLGAAYQAGALPLPADEIEAAIELNGTAVEANLQAFRRGRQAVAAPEDLRAAERALTPAPPDPRPLSDAVGALIGRVPDADGELLRKLTIRVPDLVEYANHAYARQYVDFIASVRRAELDRTPGSSAISEAVAVGLHKLMAYKDEYEVARLHLDPAFRRQVEATFGGGARVAFRLHPPLLRALGLDRKLALGPWFVPALKALRRMRRLRGTPLDPFGRAKVRRVERRLVRDYREAISAAMQRLAPESRELVLELAQLPDMVRGYEEIKLANVERFEARAAELGAALG
jgi:indolepyruvate ferredoxin oxidoreductase